MPVNRPLQVLLVQSDDTALVLEQLQKVGSRTIVSERVETVKAFREALEKNNWDIAIARFDYRVSIAQLSYAELLHILREYQLDIPLILVVEEITVSVAIRAIKAGVKDIVTTAELERLNESVEYELHVTQSQAGLNQTKQELELRVQERTAQLQQEISERIQAEAILTGQNQVLEAMLGLSSLHEVLDTLARVIERLSGEMKCSFLLADLKNSQLHHGAAPSLPDEYNQAMDGIAIDSSACSCTAAAETKEIAIVEDIANDPSWLENRSIALKYGLRACWSLPILTSCGELLGMFVIYYSEPRTPSDADKQLITKAIHLAAIAIERFSTESTLKRTQAQLQQLAANIPGVIYQFLLTPEGTYSFPFLSPSCYEIYELTPAQIEENPKKLLEIVHRRERSHLALSVARSAATLQPWEWEGKINTPSGQQKWLKGAARPVRQPNGDILWDGLIMDITESKLTEAALVESEAQLRQQATELEQALYQLNSTQAQLIQTEKMSSLGQLVAGIAHEINNPVNFIYNNLNFATEYSQNILNLLELYQQHYPNPPIEIQSQAEEIELDFVKEDLPKILSSMQMGTDRICEIILSLRNFSRIDQKTPQTIDIHQVIDSVILILQHRLRRIGDNPGIEIIKQYQQLPLLKCYPGQLNQVFMNLIANAIDAVEEGVGSRELLPTPSIRIRTRLSDNPSCVLICIADNGSGISPEKQQHIFNTFFTTKPVGKGTGLGLSISQQIIVEKHCGRLWCTSELGQGTEFWIEIPIQGNI
jgi:signal transduction histidine kinase/PAS domain-containing protein